MLRAKRYDFLAVKEPFELFLPQLRVVPGLLDPRELASVVDKLERLIVALKHDLKLLKQALSGLLFGIQPDNVSVGGSILGGRRIQVIAGRVAARTLHWLVLLLGLARDHHLMVIVLAHLERRR